MNLKIKIIALFVLLIAFCSTVKTTYSRYVSEAMGTVSTNIAKWKIKVNNTDITSASSRTVTITPNTSESPYVTSGKVAPGSTGYFDLVIDSSDAEVAFVSNVDIHFESNRRTRSGSNITTFDGTDNKDLIITSYDVNLGSSYNASTKTTTVVNGQDASFTSDPFMPNASYHTIRVYFKWNDDPNTEVNDDAADTEMGLRAANMSANELMPEVQVTLSYSQYTG